jgi:dolichol-phosphate mannosyltransferase
MRSAALFLKDPAQARYVAVMDADLQHDEKLLPRMLAILRSGESDMVVGSRYVDGGSSDAFSKQRSFMSRFATALARRFTGVELKDPMSGFFMIRRAVFDETTGRAIAGAANQKHERAAC